MSGKNSNKRRKGKRKKRFTKYKEIGRIENMRIAVSVSMALTTGEIVCRYSEEDGIKQSQYIERLIIKDGESREKQGKKEK